MKPTWIMLVSAALAVSASAGEHPTKEAKAHEHPSHEHPTEAQKNAKKELIANYSATVEKHVADASAKQGGDFVVKDDKLGKEWRLKLDRIHKKKIVSLGEDRFFACADFKQSGEGFFKSTFSPTKLDLDFYVRKAGEGWQVEQVLVHKVEGEPRYVYNDKNERVPVTAKAHEHPKGEHPTQEHPAKEHPAQEHPAPAQEHPKPN